MMQTHFCLLSPSAYHNAYKRAMERQEGEDSQTDAQPPTSASSSSSSNKREDEEQQDGRSELKLFGGPLRRQMVFQLCDLSSWGLQQTIMNLPRKPSGSGIQGGWFHVEDLNALRTRIKVGTYKWRTSRVGGLLFGGK